MTLLDQISDALGASGALGDLSSSLGASPAETDSMLSAALPAILGGLGARSSGDGMNALTGLLKDDGGSFVDSLGSFFSHGDKTGLASKLVSALFGSQRSGIESHIAAGSSGAMSTVSRLLPMLAPAVIGFVSKIVKDEELDADGLGEKLAAIGATGPLADLVASSVDEDQAGFIDGVTAVRDAGGLGALVPATAPVSTASVSAAPVAVAAAAGGAGAGAVTTLAAPADGDDRDRNGLGWLPTVLLPVLALIIGLVLWQCTSTTNDVAVDVGDATEAEQAPAESEAEVEAEAEPEAEATAEPTPDPTAVPEPTATPEPTAVPVVTIADLALGNPELSTLTDIAADLDLVGPLSDPDAGPFTVFAPTNDAFASAQALLGRLDDDQTLTTVTHHVVPGIVTAADLTPGATFETLAGETLTVGADGTLTGGISVTTADITADNGVVHIIGRVLVPGSISRSLAAQDVNQAFELNPIQFNLGSADILPASQGTLDEAITTLTSLPTGTVFEVQGHTDSQGSDAPNQELSEARAASVVAYLVAGGVDADMLVAAGYGESQLKVDPEVTPEDFAANRRIEFVDISNG